MNSVQTKVAEQIVTIVPKVEDAVVAVLVERELDKRSDALVKIIDALAKLEADLKKVKPDQVSLDVDGKEVASTYSKMKIEERNKLVQKIGKHEKAIQKALETGDFGDVYNIGNSKSGGDDVKVPVLAEADF